MQKDLQSYNPKASSSSTNVSANHPICMDHVLDGHPSCAYTIGYESNMSIKGYYVQDVMTFSDVSGDHQTQPLKENIMFL